MNYRKFKSYALSSSFILSAVVLISWSQPWFTLAVTFPTENPNGLEVSGQVAAPGLSAFGLAGFAVTAALSLSSILIRRILGMILMFLGIAIATVSVVAWGDPVVSSSSLLTSLSAISDIETQRTFVVSSTITVWPTLSAFAGILMIPLGMVIFFTSGKWGTGSRKFDRVSHEPTHTSNTASKLRNMSNTDVSDSNIDAWDSLSHGTDPTIN